jgi:hypothetical protein
MEVAIMAELTQQPGELNLTVKSGDDLSFDIVANTDLTGYTYGATITPLTVSGATDVPFTITVNDLTTGGLHFYVSKTLLAPLPILTNKHKWNFYWSIGGFRRTILSGYFNIEGV